MNKEWLAKVNMTEKEWKELEKWCENIGFERYEKIYDLIVSIKKNERVNYEELRTIARYDFSLSDMLHSMMKFVELRFRSYLINHYGEVKLTKKGYVHEITSDLGKNKKKLDCSTYYDSKLKNNTTLKQFLEVSGLETMFKVLLVLSDEELQLFESDPKSFRNNLTVIREMRNKISHGQYLMSEKGKLKKALILLLKYMPTDESKKKRIEELRNLNDRLLNECGNVEKKLIDVIKISLNEVDLKEIGL